MRQLEANARSSRRKRPRSFVIGVIAMVVGIVGLVVCIVRHLAALPGW
jgi:t-SNARE complex subunit (syntaxin)